MASREMRLSITDVPEVVTMIADLTAERDRLRAAVDALVAEIRGLLAPDEATVERVAAAVHDHACPSDPEAGCSWFEDGLGPCRTSDFGGFARAVLAALADPAEEPYEPDTTYLTEES